MVSGTYHDITMVLAGIGIFLVGMNMLEESLRRLAGRPFKLYLRRQAGNKLKAVVGGAVVTAVLQSGSVVNLMVLAFVGSGVLNLRNALAVILGSNIGTTLDSWVVALIGFKFNIESFAYPLIGFSGILMALSERGTKWQTWSRFSFGTAALFVGLDLIKGGFSNMVEQVDFSAYAGYPLIFFLLIGFVITALIQSSYAMVAITLSALHAGAITIVPATAIILGSEVGTTIKLLIAAAAGQAAKRRVAYANFIYNLVVIVLVFMAIRPLNAFISRVAGVGDPLVALVFFQSLINVAGALLFFPFLNTGARILEKKFPDSFTTARYIGTVPSGAGDLAMEVFEKETRRFIQLTLQFMASAFHVEAASRIREDADAGFIHRPMTAQYELLKSLHGELHAWFIGLRKALQEESDRERADQLISSVRNVMFAAKSFHDSESDISQFRNSSNDEKYRIYTGAKAAVAAFCERSDSIMSTTGGELFDLLVSHYREVQEGYAAQSGRFYREGLQAALNELELSTLVNFNRELYSGFKAMAWAINDLLLDRKQSGYFAELPGFIR